MRQAYGKFAQYANDVVERYGQLINDPQQLAIYNAAKRDYRMGTLLSHPAEYQESKNLIGGPAGHNTLRGVLGQLTEAFTGLPPVGQIAKNALAKTAPAVKAVGNAGGATARGAGNLIKGLPKEAQYGLSNYLESKYGKKGQ